MLVVLGKKMSPLAKRTLLIAALQIACDIKYFSSKYIFEKKIVEYK